MTSISSARIYLIIALLFSLSSMPVLGQTSNAELFSGLFEIFSTGGNIHSELVDEAKAGIGNTYQRIEAVNYYNDAYRYYNYGNYDLALMCVKKSIEAWEQADYLQELPSVMGDLSPTDSWNLKGLILNKLGRCEEAIYCFDVALDMDPENFYAWANKGDILYDQGNYEGAIKLYNNAISINPSYAFAYTRKNRALSELQDKSTPSINTYNSWNDNIPTDNTSHDAFITITEGESGETGYGGFSMATQYGSYSSIAGSGNVVSESRTIDKFNSIKLMAPGDLYLTQDTHQPLVIEGEDDILQVLTTNVVADCLIIKINGFTRPTKPINIYASTEEIRGVEIVSGNVIGQSVINSDRLKLDITGSGSSDLSLNVRELDTSVTGSGCLDIKGTADIHNSILTGSGNIKAFDLTTETTDIKVSGSGLAQVNAFNDLNIEITGSGTVYYKGNATVDQSITGSGTIKRI